MAYSRRGHAPHPHPPGAAAAVLLVCLAAVACLDERSPGQARRSTVADAGDTATPPTLTIHAYPRDACVPVGGRVEIRVEVTDGTTGAAAANRLVAATVDAGQGRLEGDGERVQVVLVHEPDAARSVPVAPIYYTCPDSPGSYRVRVAFVEGDHGAIAEAVVECAVACPP